MGTGMGLAFGHLSKPPGAKLIPYLIPPEDVIPGVANWYASLCTQCGAGCGTLVQVMDGRAKKIEGNPLHPVNKGRLCARGQASLQALYNPDRIRTPLKRTGERGSASFTKISWDEAISTLSEKLSILASEGNADRLYLLTTPLGGNLNTLVNDFMTAYGSGNKLTHELFGNTSLEYANRASMGIDAIPHYDIEKTKFLLSFGADFSGTWLSPVNLSHGYGEMRQGPHGPRGHLVQVEPRMSPTGAIADEWVPAKPGTEAVFALAIAHEIVESGHYRGADAPRWKALLKDYSPAYAAAVTDVAEQRIHHIAMEFIKVRPSLAIGGGTMSGYTNGVSGLVAVNILNHLAGNLGKDGGVIPNPEALSGASARTEKKDGLAKLITDAADSKVGALLVCNANPVFTAPGGAKVREALRRVPFIASLSSFMDETTAEADLVLPVHTSLEEWGDDLASPSVGYTVATVMQPVVSPIYDTRGLGDIFISIGNKMSDLGMGGRISASMPKTGFDKYLKAAWKKFYSNNREASASAISFTQFWNRLLAQGGWWPEPSRRNRRLRVSRNGVKRYLSKAPSGFDGNSKEYPLYLMLYPQAGHVDGRGANLPWLQELPDPMTSVVWGSWVEINPKTAKKLNIKEGAFVEIPLYAVA